MPEQITRNNAPAPCTREGHVPRGRGHGDSDRFANPNCWGRGGCLRSHTTCRLGSSKTRRSCITCVQRTAYSPTYNRSAAHCTLHSPRRGSVSMQGADYPSVSCPLQSQIDQDPSERFPLGISPAPASPPHFDRELGQPAPWPHDRQLASSKAASVRAHPAIRTQSHPARELSSHGGRALRAPFRREHHGVHREPARGQCGPSAP